MRVLEGKYDSTFYNPGVMGDFYRLDMNPWNPKGKD